MAALAGCSRAPRHTVDRLAVLPFENLSGEGALDWVGAVTPRILVAEISDDNSEFPYLAGTIGEAYASGATRLLHGYYYQRAGLLKIEAWIEDLSSHKMVQELKSEGQLGGGLPPLVQTIGRALFAGSRPYPVHNPAALIPWGRALVATDPPARLAGFQHAVAQDPDLGAAYLGWAETLLQTGDRAAAEQVVEKALARPALKTEIDQARIELLRANLHDDQSARLRALDKLMRVAPADSGAVERLAEAEMAARNFTVAVDLYRNAIKLAPENAALVNSLGYAQALAGDLDGAKRSLEAYSKLPGQDVNGLDSLGEVCFYHGRFGEAERYFLAASAKNVAFLAGQDLEKAAFARWIQGDSAGAEKLFQRFLDFRRKVKDSLVEWRLADFEYMSGNRKQAIERLASFSQSSEPGAASFADSQLSVWLLEAGDRDAARQRAEKAGLEASDPQSRNLALLCRMLVEPALAPSAPKIAAAYALLLRKDYGEAAPLWKDIYRVTSPTEDGQVRTLYAWALIGNGRVKEAAQLVELYPIPEANGEAIFSSLVYPRFLELRAKVKEAEGKRDEAAALLKLWRQYGGEGN